MRNARPDHRRPTPCAGAGAVARRLARPEGAPPLSTIRSLAYFSPVIEEVQQLQAGPDYSQYIRRRLAQMLPTRQSP